MRTLGEDLPGFDEENSSFWDEPCGSTFAEMYGLDPSTTDGLAEFDRNYMAFYPYLNEFLEAATSGADSVVEVGLGLGTVSRRLAQMGLDYVGIDVAKQPCEFVDASFKALGLNGTFYNRSILSTTRSDVAGPFDTAIAIGSLHHTGDLSLAVRRLEDLVTPGGRMLIMVYREFTPRRVLANPRRAWRHWRDLRVGRRFWWNENDADARLSHDANSRGEAPPSTAFASEEAWRHLFSPEVTFEISRRNFHRIGLPKTQFEIPRDAVLNSLGRLWGLDLYVSARKRVETN